MSVVLRPARPCDAAPCAAILRAWIDECPWFPTRYPASADAPFIAAKIAKGEVTVARAEEVLGFVAVEEGYVSCLYVGAAHRGRGVGAALLDAAKARAARLSLWTFAANTGARAFYLRAGFAEARRTPGDNEENLPDIEYVWRREGT